MAEPEARQPPDVGIKKSYYQRVRDYAFNEGVAFGQKQLILAMLEASPKPSNDILFIRSISWPKDRLIEMALDLLRGHSLDEVEARYHQPRPTSPEAP